MRHADTSETWESFEMKWRVHAQTARFKRRLHHATEVARDGAKLGRMFAGMSGGKDSAALAAVLCAAGLRETIPLVYCHSDLNTPGMEETALAIAEKLDMDLDIVEPDFPVGTRDVWQFLRELPREISIFDERNHLRLRKACASGNMLVAYQYDRGFSGAFSGMRAEESRGRLMNRKVRGDTYQIKKDGAWMCHPLADWDGLDVWAMIASCGLPSCAHYRTLLERYHVPPESPRSRVDCVLTEDQIVGVGSLEHLRRLYPELYGRILRERPEIGQL